MFDRWRRRTVLITGLAGLIGVVVGFFLVAAYGDATPGPEPSAVGPPTASTAIGSVRPSLSGGRVPDVVGQRLPAAEQSLTAAGFLSLQERDASNQGRTVLEKENWVVVAQDPPAGATSPPTTVVVLALKKPTDEHVPVVIGSGVMPNVVCAELQTAQDVIRASRLYAIISRDATGQGRSILLDRNWIVVAQSIRPGTSPGLTTPIELSVVKYSEPSGSSACPT